MIDSTVVKVYEEYRSKIKKIGLTLTILDVDDPWPNFAVTTNNFGTKTKMYELINKHRSACTQDKCPIALVSTLDEVAAVAMGFCLSNGKSFPL